MQKKPLIYSAIAIVIVGFLLFVRVPEIGENQDTNTANSGEVTGDILVGQTFIASQDNLKSVGVMMATYSGRNNTHPIVFELKESSDSPTIRTVSVSPEAFGDNQFYDFSFEPITDSKGKTFFFSITSPESVKGNAVAVNINQQDPYPGGVAHIRGSGRQAIDLAFRVSYNVPLGVHSVRVVRQAVHTFIATWQDNRHVYLLWTGAFLPSVVVVLLCVLLFGFKKQPKPWIILLILAIIAATIRIFYATSLPFTDDEGNYLYDAWSLLHGQFAGGDGYVKTPLVILWIALWEAILGHTALAGRLSSVIAGSALVYPIFLLVRSLWSTRAGLISAALWACMGAAVVSTIYVHTQSVAIFFGVSAIALLAYALREKSAQMKWLILAGCVIGLAVASRKSMLAIGLTVILLLVLQSKSWKAALRNTMFVGIGFFAVLTIFLSYAYGVYGSVGVMEALGINSAEDGIATIDPDQVEQIREYSLKGMTPFFRESLPIILLSLLGVGLYLQESIASFGKKSKQIDVSRIAWIIPLGIFWWAWGFFSEYEGAKFMQYGIPLLWWLFGILLLAATTLPALKGTSKNDSWTRGLLGIIWVGSMMFFYAKWIKFHANYISEFIPPLTIIAGVGLEAFIARSLHIRQRILKYIALGALLVVAVWAATVSSFITYLFEHTGTFDQKAAYEAATWIQQNIPEGEVVFTGASLIPYLAGYQTALNISHPRWYAYEFTRTNPERIETFMPSGKELVSAFKQSNWFLMDAQTKFSYLNEYDDITNDLNKNWKSIQGISNGSNTLTFYQRIRAAQ